MSDVTSEKAPCGCNPCKCCYDKIPDTLTATLHVVDGTCPCVEGATVTLTKTEIDDIDAVCAAIGVDDPIDSTPRWSGSGTVCGTTFCMCLRPCEGTYPGYECDLGENDTPFALFISSPGACAGAMEANTNYCEKEASCDPVHLRFGFGNAVLIQWCSDEFGYIEITITPQT